MGSFNETCALSNHTISPGDPVRLLFLTQNPYISSDGRVSQRGCYVTDQWFVRTPPIKGKYDDYGTCDFKEGPLTNLITKLLSEDVVEKPFGFNQCHEPDVTKTKGIRHFLNAAWEGRLSVHDKYRYSEEKVPDNFPTWRKVHDILRNAGLPIQLDSDSDEGCKGYNAQPVRRGVVCVDFNDYGDNSKRFAKAKKILSDLYDCEMAYKFPDRKDVDPCLMVVAKGAFADPIMLADVDDIKASFGHPDMRERSRVLPVVTVMILEDVWQIYSKLNLENFHGENPSVKFMLEKMNEILTTKKYPEDGPNPDIVAANKKLNKGMARMSLDGIMRTIPFQTMVSTHLSRAVSDEGFTKKQLEDLFKSCAEFCYIERVMMELCQSWYVPPLGGQHTCWQMRAKLHQKLSERSLKKQKEEDTY